MGGTEEEYNLTVYKWYYREMRSEKLENDYRAAV